MNNGRSELILSCWIALLISVPGFYFVVDANALTYYDFSSSPDPSLATAIKLLIEWAYFLVHVSASGLLALLLISGRARYSWLRPVVVGILWAALLVLVSSHIGLSPSTKTFYILLCFPVVACLCAVFGARWCRKSG